MSPKINNHKAINNYVQLLNTMIQVTQQDSEANLALARETKELAAASKQDSSAMKIIAFLTTVFLPGTFVAVHALSISAVKILIKSQTLFSMPFFNWDAESVSHAANSNFWFYWAVTGPLTLATMFIVIAWAVWRYRKTEKLREEARESPVLGSNFYFEKGKNGSRISVDPGEEEEMAETTKRPFVMPNFMQNTFKTRRQSSMGKKGGLGRGDALVRRDTFESVEIGRGPPLVRRGTQFSTMSERGAEKQGTLNTVDIS
jgi:hypothetical protein